MSKLNGSKLLGDLGGVTWLVLIILAFTFMARASNNMIQTTVPLMAKEYFNASNAEVGLLGSVISAFSFISTAFVNARLSSERRRIMFELSTVLYFITFLIYPFINYIGL
jgi:hypothetical protein